MENNELEQLYFEQISRISKALSSPSRLKLLDALSYRPHSVEKLAEQTGLTTANTSQHLQKLKEVRLVETEKKGTQVYYSLSSPDVSRFYRELQKIGEQHLFEIKSIIDQFHRDAETLEKVNMDTLNRKAKNGEVIVLDVRPVKEFQKESLPNAVSIPLEELEEQLDKLPRDKKIFAYCRGSYCILSDKAVQKLRQKGYKAHSLNEGIEEWKTRGIKLAP
jgi:rhodanese-related sulfurtransferase/biotin operon repressor